MKEFLAVLLGLTVFVFAVSGLAYLTQSPPEIITVEHVIEGGVVANNRFYPVRESDLQYLCLLVPGEKLFARMVEPRVYDIEPWHREPVAPVNIPIKVFWQPLGSTLVHPLALLSYLMLGLVFWLRRNLPVSRP